MRNCANIIYIDVVLLFLSLIILSSLILHKKEEFVNRVLKSVVELNSDLSGLSARFPMFEIYIDNGNQTTVQKAIESLYPNLTSAIVLCRYRLAAGSGVALIYNAGANYGSCLCADRASNRLVCGIYGNNGWNWTFPA